MNIHTNELTVEVYVRPDGLVEPIDTKSTRYTGSTLRIILTTW